MKFDTNILYYAALGFLPPFIERLDALTPEKMQAMVWNNWTVLILVPVYSALLTLKALKSKPKEPSP